MGQMTIYLDSETEKRLKMVLKSSRLSKSKWITNIIREKIKNQWPEAVRKMAGAWEDLPLAETMRKSPGADAKRENL